MPAVFFRVSVLPQNGAEYSLSVNKEVRMFSSDLEIQKVAEEQHKDLLRAAEQHRRNRSIMISRRRTLRLWVGNQLIILGERLKGDI